MVDTPRNFSDLAKAQPLGPIPFDGECFVGSLREIVTKGRLELLFDPLRDMDDDVHSPALSPCESRPLDHQDQATVDTRFLSRAGNPAASPRFHHSHPSALWGMVRLSSYLPPAILHNLGELLSNCLRFPS
jgi:hypothetical protein